MLCSVDLSLKNLNRQCVKWLLQHPYWCSAKICVTCVLNATVQSFYPSVLFYCTLYYCRNSFLVVCAVLTRHAVAWPLYIPIDFCLVSLYILGFQECKRAVTDSCTINYVLLSALYATLFCATFDPLSSR